MGLLARLYRMVPLIVILIVLALIVYGIVSFRRSPARAKEVLIKFFTILTIIISAFFALVTIYGLFESHEGVIDLAGSCLVVSVVALVITRWCNHIFLKHNPHYRNKRTGKAKIVRRWPWNRHRQS